MKEIKKNNVYNFASQEAYEDFMQTAEKQGFFKSYKEKIKTINFFNIHKEETCIRVSNNNAFIYSNRYHFTNRGREIIEWKIEDEPPTIVMHIIRGNKTIVKLSNGKVGVARCHPDDKFDIYEGLRVATARAYGKPVEEPKEEPKKDVLKVICTWSNSPMDFVVGKVYERVNGVLTDDRGFNWDGPCKGDDPRRWVFSMAKFELYEEPKVEPKKDILKVKCVRVNKGIDWWTVGKVYERVDGLIMDDRGNKWIDGIDNDDPTMWGFINVKFELYEEPEEKVEVCETLPCFDHGTRIERLETAVIALANMVNQHTQELKPWNRGKK